MRIPVIAAGLFTTAVFAQTPCERLKSAALGDAVVMTAEAVAAGPYKLPWLAPGASPPVLPAHCRLALTLTPTSDSDIKAELWLPLASDWNGKLVAVGNGGSPEQ